MNKIFIFIVANIFGHINIQNRGKTKNWKEKIAYFFPKNSLIFSIYSEVKVRGVSEVRFKKNRPLHLGNVEKPPHPHFSAQRAREG